MGKIAGTMARLLIESQQKYRKYVFYLDLCFATECCDESDEEMKEGRLKWHAFHIEVRK